MTQFLKAADEIGKLIKMFSALEVLRPELARVGSLEQAAREAQSVLDRQAVVLAAAKLDLDKALGESAKAREESAGAAAWALAERASVKSYVLEEQAQAHKQADAIRASADGYLASEQAKEKAELEAIRAKVVAAKLDLEDITARSAAARNALRKLAGV